MNRTVISAGVVATIGLILLIYFWNGSTSSPDGHASSATTSDPGISGSGFPSNDGIPRRPKVSTIDEEAKEFRKMWGSKMNPAGDCEFHSDGSTLRMKVPGSDTPHDLNPEVGLPGNDDAPRVLKPVEGDFVVEVMMNAVEDPGEESTQPGFSGYVGAGLVVFADARNFVRLERATLRRPGGDPKPYTNFEIRIDGVTERFGGISDLPTEHGRPTWLRIERKGAEMHGSMSHDGENWITTEPKTLPSETWDKGGIQAGLAAISTSKWSFEPEFSEFSITQGGSEPGE